MRRKIFFFSGLLLLFTLVNAGIFLVSKWKNTKTDQAIIQQIEESLNNSSQIIDRYSLMTLQSLNEKRFDPVTSSKAVLLYPRAEKIAKLTKELTEYIEKLKSGQPITSDQSYELLSALKKYNTDALTIYEGFQKSFGNQIFSILKDDSISVSKENFYHKYLSGSSEKTFKAFLTSLQNEAKNFENRGIMYINESYTNHVLICTFPSPLIIQNRSIAQKGDQIEIKAGIGSFEWFPDFEVRIHDKPIPVNAYNFIEYKFKVSQKPGRYSMPVQMNYMDQDGKKQTISKNVEYTVAKECDQ